MTPDQNGPDLSRTLARLAQQTGAIRQDSSNSSSSNGFTLRSGQTSNTYLDGITLALDPRAARIIGDELLRQATLAGATVIAGPALGAAPMVSAAVARGEHIRPRIRGALIRDEWKNHGITGLIAGQLEPNDRVLLVDDVMTTGASLSMSRQTIQEIGLAQVAGTVVLLDRRPPVPNVPNVPTLPEDRPPGQQTDQDPPGPVHSIIRMEDLRLEYPERP